MEEKPGTGEGAKGAANCLTEGAGVGNLDKGGSTNLSSFNGISEEEGSITEEMVPGGKELTMICSPLFMGIELRKSCSEIRIG